MILVLSKQVEIMESLLSEREMESDLDVWTPLLQVHSEHLSEAYSLPVAGRERLVVAQTIF